MRNARLARGTPVLVSVSVAGKPGYSELPGIVLSSFICMNGKRYYEVELDEGGIVSPITRDRVKAMSFEVVKALIG